MLGAATRQRTDAELDGWQAEVARYWTPDRDDTRNWEPTTEIMRLWTNVSASGAEWTRSLIQRLERDLERDAEE